MQRICPVCREKLISNDHYFCGNCGAVLEETLSQPIDSSKKVVDLNVKKNGPSGVTSHFSDVFRDIIHITNVKGIILLLALLAFIGVPTFLFLDDFQETIQLMRLGYNNPKPARSNSITVNESTSSVKTLNLKPTVFNNQELISYVPYTADFLVEGGDISGLFALVSGGDTFYEGLSDLFKLIKADTYVGYGKVTDEGIVWSAIITANNLDELNLENIPDSYSWLTFRVQGDKLIISNSQVETNEILEAASGLGKSLNQNPVYVSMRSKFPKNGPMLVVAITGDGKYALQGLSYKEVPELVKEKVSDKINGSDNYFILE